MIMSSVEKVSRGSRCLMLKRFIEAWPRRMQKLSQHFDVLDVISILEFSPLWLVFKPLGMLHVAYSIMSAHCGLMLMESRGGKSSHCL